MPRYIIERRAGRSTDEVSEVAIPVSPDRFR